MRKFLEPIFNFNKKKKEEIENTAIEQDYYRELEIDVLARTIFGEARSEGADGMEAVACVVLNRRAVAKKMGGYWWGNSIIDICQKPFQFSCWNKDDPNLKRIQTVTDKDLVFQTALRIARRAVIGSLRDTTLGATHYHADYVSPYWAKNQRPVTQIGRHIFYTLVEV